MPSDPAVRSALDRRWEEEGGAALHAELARIDPETASKVHPADRHRVVRALEIAAVGGVPAGKARSAWTAARKRHESLFLALWPDRGELYRRIDARTEEMFRVGLVNEVRDLLRMGYGRDLKPMRGLGYRQAVSHLLDGVPLPQAVESTKRDTRRYAKRQLTWLSTEPELVRTGPRKCPGGGRGTCQYVLVVAVNQNKIWVYATTGGSCMILQYLDFERPIVDLENRLDQLQRMDDGSDKSVREEAAKLEKKIGKIRKEIFSNLTRWQITQLARHPNRPYLYRLHKPRVQEFHGNPRRQGVPRRPAHHLRVRGAGRAADPRDRPAEGAQHQREDPAELRHGEPEGYRKALRAMKLAEKFSLPVLTFIDTPGAFPGIGAEERGQSEAIARNLLEMSRLETPIVVTVLGEGGSGGALALGVGDEILMLEYSVYSVISPEGCASILWRDTAKAEVAADMMKITAPDLKKFGVIDRIIPEPMGGAHRDHKAAAESLKTALVEALSPLLSMPVQKLLDRRYRKFREMGVVKKRSGG